MSTTSLPNVCQKILYLFISLNPVPVILGVLNTRFTRTKSLLRADTTTSHDLDFLYLAETHVHSSDSDSFPCSNTPPSFVFPQRPCDSKAFPNDTKKLVCIY